MFYVPIFLFASWIKILCFVEKIYYKRFFYVKYGNHFPVDIKPLYVENVTGNCKI